MPQILTSLSIWLHTVATVIFLGHYLLLALIYLPVLSSVDNSALLSEMSKRSRLWLYASLVAFVVTGMILMFAAPNYLGFGDFGNAWGIVIVVKHVLILGMIIAGFWFNAILRVGPTLNANHGRTEALARFRLSVRVMALSGMLVLLLTAVAQTV